MTSLEDIKRKKLEDLKNAQENAAQSQVQEQAQVSQQIQQLESIVRTTLTKEALERYGNLKAAHPEKSIQLLVVLAQAIQNGQIKTIDDVQLKEILIKLSGEKKQFNIRRV